MRKYLLITLATLAGLAAIVLALAYLRPLPALQPVVSGDTQGSPANPQMQWSLYGEQAITVAGQPGFLLTHGEQKQLPTASIAKIMAALAILRQKPLNQGEQGPSVTISAADVAAYQNAVAQGESTLRVTAGERLTEYQMLQAMLIPSANNIANLATAWAYGSVDQYLAFANNYAKELGMTDTHFTDASGVSPQTVSTPQDLLKLGETAMKNPVIAQIVRQKSATLPVVGEVYNYNSALGINGIIGIKTGNTDGDAGALLYAARQNGVLVIGISMGAPDLGTAVHDAPEIMGSYQNSLATIRPVHAGDVVGHYTVPWGGTVNAVAQKDVSAIVWSGTKLPQKVTLEPIGGTRGTSRPVGTINVKNNITGETQTAPVVLEHAVPQPGFWWRLFRR